MTPARLAELLALLAAVAAALVLARRDRGHRRLAAGLCALLVVDVARLPLRGAEGWPWRLDVALVAAWFVGYAAIVRHNLTNRGKSYALLAEHGVTWLSLTSALPLLAPASPELRRPWMAAAWRLVYLLALAAQLAAALPFVARSWRTRRRPSPAETVACLLVASSLAELPGPWLRVAGLAPWWGLAQLNATLTWGAVALVQGYFVATAGPSKKSERGG